MFGLLVFGVIVMAQVAIGQELGANELPLLPDCQIIEAVSTWGQPGAIIASALAAVAALRPFSNLILKLALALGAMPAAWAKVSSKVAWVVGTVAAMPCWGTPKVMKDVYAGKVEPVVDMKKLTKFVKKKEPGNG